MGAVYEVALPESNERWALKILLNGREQSGTTRALRS